MGLVKRTPHGEYCAVMYRWPWEDGDPASARVIWVPMQQVAWRKSFGWRLVLEDAEINLTLSLGQTWKEPEPPRKPFYPPTPFPMRPPDDGANDHGD